MSDGVSDDCRYCWEVHRRYCVLVRVDDGAELLKIKRKDPKLLELSEWSWGRWGDRLDVTRTISSGQADETQRWWETFGK